MKRDYSGNIYLDTSVLVSLYVPELHTVSMTHYLRHVQGEILISNLVETEFYATLAKKKRTKELTVSQIQAIIDMFTQHVNSRAFQSQFITDQVFSYANMLLKEMKANLRTLDALHLAASKVANCQLVTADKDLAQSAKIFKIPVNLI